MSDYTYPRLCGGTFFVLLLQARKQLIKGRDMGYGDSEKLSEPDMLFSLILIADPHYEKPTKSSFQNNTSRYQSCRISGSLSLPFEENTFIAGFNKRVKESYKDAYDATRCFSDRFLDLENVGKIEHLTKSLLDLIEKDNTIAETDCFVFSDSRSKTKGDILRMTSIPLQQLLLAIWHFIITQRIDNTVGRGTYEMWHEKPSVIGQKYRFISQIGSGFTGSIAVTLMDDGVGSERSCEKNSEASKASSVTSTMNLEPSPIDAQIIGDKTIRLPVNATIGSSVNIIIPNKAAGSVETKEHKITLDTNYYNLFVVGKETYRGKHFVVPPKRVLNSGMSSEVINQFSTLDAESIERIKRLPSIFAAENRFLHEDDDFPDQNAYLGIVTDITNQDNGLRISFYRISTVSQKRLLRISHKLGIYHLSNYSELNTTHWAIKKIDLLDVLAVEGIDVITDFTT